MNLPPNSRRGPAGREGTPVGNPLEMHYTVQEIAKEWKVDAETVRSVFIDEPGVLQLGSSNRKDGKRNYVILRIPASVLKRVYERRTQRKFSIPTDQVSRNWRRTGGSERQPHPQKRVVVQERKDPNG